MDFRYINNLVEQYVNDKHNNYILSNLDNLKTKCLDVISKPEYSLITKEWSRKIDINETLNIIYKYLIELDSDLANQFVNLVRATDENNMPIVNLIDKKTSPNGNDVVKDGKVYIYYENIPNDLFKVLHEMLHKMNENWINTVDENGNSMVDENDVRKVYGESVSITGEMLFGEYIVKNGIITDNDFNIRRNERLVNTKIDAESVLINIELLKMKLQGHEINELNISNLVNSYNQNNLEYNIFIRAISNPQKAPHIMKNNRLNINERQRYVIAQVVSDDIVSKENGESIFINLNNYVKNQDSELDEVSRIISSSNKKL